MATSAAKADPFEASASMIGYVYQLRKALHCAVVRYGSADLDWCLAIEAGDDIEETVIDGKILHQLKHRAPGVKVTDFSVDLWKTLRIWAHAVATGQIDLDETDLLLLTTAEIGPGTAASYLQPSPSGTRDVDAAFRILDQAGQKSKNDDVKKAYGVFGKLPPEIQKRLLARVQVIGQAPDIDAVKELLMERARFAVGRAHAASFLQRLEGWFLQRAIRQLRSAGLDPVTGDEFDQIFTDLRDQFRPENLPIDDDIAALEPESTEHVDKTFVHQLRLIEVGDNRISFAVRDYIRAFTQRSRWVNENLVRTGEIGAYERRLVEAWESRFAEMAEDLGEQAAEAEKIKAAKAIYSWAQNVDIPIRRDCSEAFICKGSFHILADEPRIGWHVDFGARLIAILEPAGAATP